MSEFPECPFCEHQLTESIPETIEGSIRIRCPSCQQRYEFIPKTGSFPLDEDYGITVTKGILGPHVISKSTEATDELSLSRALLIGGSCCCTIVVIIPIVLSLLLALLG
ncbi:MAG: hypothetical protein AM326_04345 [Candidatus Thorarchaeota archaeon SMTZ-45]|nr:MAG: hypothetical protein AM326_04345 [Candidatus Thorarchaeota archaeon SMTZ-45]